ncbi:MAG: hypothetical protein WCT52_03090 [Candidatus Micrarchaeia archaeon]|jgi:hypothetical protein
MDRKILAAMPVFAILALAGVAFAAQGWENAGMGNGMGNAASLNPAEHEQFQAAVETGDFAAATALHGQYGFGGRMFESLDAKSFAKFSEMHNAMQSGDYEKAQEIRAELRADGGFGTGKGAGQNAGSGRQNAAGAGRGMRAGVSGGCPYANSA